MYNIICYINISLSGKFDILHKKQERVTNKIINENR